MSHYGKWHQLTTFSVLVCICLSACAGSKSPELYDTVMQIDKYDDVGLEFFSVNYAPDGTLLSVDNTGIGQLWRVETGENIRTFAVPADCWVFGASYSPDGTRLLIPRDKSPLVWDVVTRAALVELKGHTQPVKTAWFSPDGMHIITASSDQTVRVWDANTGEETLQIHASDCDGCSLAAFYNADGTLIGTASGDGFARVFDATTGELLSKISLEHTTYNSVAFNPIDDNLIAIGDGGNVTLWSIKEEKILWKFEAQDGWTLRTVFSPDGTKVASIGYYGGVWLLDAKTGTLLHSLEDFKRVNSIAYSPDGSTIAVAGDQRLRVYLVDTK